MASSVPHLDSEKLITELSSTDTVRAMAGEVIASFASSNFSHPSSSKSVVSSLWLFAREEVHSLLCTRSEKYRTERNLIAGSTKPAIAVLTATLVSHFGVSVGTASSLASLALLVPLKLAVNSWCAMVKANPRDLTYDEKKVLATIANDRTITAGG